MSTTGRHLALVTALLLAALAPGHAQTVMFDCTGQMRIVKQYKNSDLGDRETFPFNEKVVVDLGAKTAKIGAATFPNVEIIDGRVEGKLGTFALGEQSDSFAIDMTNGNYHHMTRVPSGEFDIFSETATDGSVCKKSEPAAKGL
jgi:hypothetical protein